MKWQRSVCLGALLCLGACFLPRETESESRVSDPVFSANFTGHWQVINSWTQSSLESRFKRMPPRLACDADDVEFFRSTGWWGLHEGKMKCGQQDPTWVAHGRWWLGTGDRLNIMYNDGELVEYKIKVLTDSSMMRFWKTHIGTQTFYRAEQLRKRSF